MSYETADILDAAADVIERDGWCQNRLGTPDGRHCLMGAIGTAIGALLPHGMAWDYYKSHDPRIGAARDAVQSLLGVDPIALSPEVAHWNDAPERTQQEVLDALRLAAKQERLATDVEVSA